MMTRSKERVFHWSLVARLEHWVRVMAILVLILTGLFIHKPFLPSGGEFFMALTRMLHMIFAYVLFLGIFARLYFAFRSDLIGDWKDFNPIKNLRNAPDVLGYYLFLKKSHRDYPRYNPLQALVYYVLALVILLQAATGFAIYTGAPVLHQAFSWINRLLGGETYTRLFHYIITWVFIIFIPVHVYLGILQSVVKKDSTFTSIFTGYKTKKA